MTAKRTVEVFSAGCPAWEEVLSLVRSIACPDCDVSVLDMHDPQVARRAQALGVRSVPAVAIDGKLADCCRGRGPDEAVLRAEERCEVRGEHEQRARNVDQEHVGNGRQQILRDLRVVRLGDRQAREAEEHGEHEAGENAQVILGIDATPFGREVEEAC